MVSQERLYDNAVFQAEKLLEMLCILRQANVRPQLLEEMAYKINQFPADTLVEALHNFHDHGRLSLKKG